MAVIIETSVTITDPDNDAVTIAPELGSDPTTYQVSASVGSASAILTGVPAEDLRALADAIVDELL